MRQKIESIIQHDLSVEEAVLAAYRLGLEDGRQEKKPQP